ncbi:MAG TPA: hypothetical protein PKD24_08830 [Pyrinomonadaceae bacterium]|nr:hypothetical protein [Pyrinomonadaceae bacterium]HMP65827.1 hypothetical protein [Pyrinomonadaceae bacterium]
MQKWEYKTADELLDDKAMNELGEEGWELVAVGCATVYDAPHTSMHFKRQIVEEKPTIPFAMA